MIIDRLFAEIDLKALINNYMLLKELSHGKDIYAVVKADAYGHGSVPCSLALEEAGCNHFAVTVLKEAIELREAGVKGEILVFGKTDSRNIDLINRYGITQTVDSYDYALALNLQNTSINVQINIDTGMSRLGIMLHKEEDLENVFQEVYKISRLKNLKITGIYSHFTSADSDIDYTNKQKHLFDKLLEKLKKEEIDYGKAHLKNSGGIIEIDDVKYDISRAGIALYGYPPVPTKQDFLPVMSLYSKVIAIRNIDVGDGVSYGRTYIASEKMKVATIAIGYADGYMRILSNNDYFFYKGYKLQVLGRVCMGLTMVDVTGVDIHEGDFVEIFGKNKSLEDMAKRAHTITYELLTNMSKPRVDRVFIK